MFQQGLDTDLEQRQRLAVCDFGGLTAKTMPYGQPAPLTLMAKLHSVLFSLDDGLCDEVNATAHDLAHETQRILRALEVPTPHWPDDTPWASALREIRLELGQHATPSQIRRWTEGMRTYLSGLVWEAACRRNPVLPSLNDYVTMWMRAIGMSPSTTMIDIVGGFEVSDADLERPEVRALTEMTWTLVSWDNDLYSRNKEILRAEDNLNLVDVLVHERGYSAAAALEEAGMMRDRVMVLFLRLREQVRPSADDGLRRYLDGLGQFVRGHLDWAQVCARYTEDIPEGTGWWKSSPQDDSLEALPIPTIAWWWDQLER